MCVAVPGRIVGIFHEEDGPVADVDFGGDLKRIYLVHTPEAKVGDYVQAQQGFALRCISELEAQQIIAVLEELAEAAAAPDFS